MSADLACHSNSVDVDEGAIGIGRSARSSRCAHMLSVAGFAAVTAEPVQI
jgi:hypothetical protein